MVHGAILVACWRQDAYSLLWLHVLHYFLIQLSNADHVKDFFSVNRFEICNSKTGSVYRRNICKECRKQDQRLNKIKRLYGLSIDEYKLMQKKQRNQCAICCISFNELQKPCIDHCHSTGRVRGVLCSKCNLSLGMVNDNVSILFSMINYLRFTTHS